MSTTHKDLQVLGWSDWFAQKADCSKEETIARVAAVDRDQLLLVDQTGTFPARLAGSYLHRHPLSHERPCVGDWVCLDTLPGQLPLVRSLVQRRTCLRRKSAGSTTSSQMIAANLDSVFVVMSCHFDFNLRRLERYLVMVADGGAEANVLLTKTDLVEDHVLSNQIAEIRAAGIRAPLLTLSNLTREGMEPLQEILLPGRTYCFVGSSGVGKSTLINHLLGRALQETNTVSRSGEGRHTTVRRELIRLDGGAMVIDNPGMREFGLVDAREGIEKYFNDIGERATSCRFRDCSHTGEPGCAVRKALDSGELDPEHFESYRKLRDESAFHDLSHGEKRKRDRDFGRFIKIAKKDFIDR